MEQDSSETVLNAEVVVLNKHGLHLSCASRLAQLASGFSCSLSLSNGKRVADAKSMLGLVTLAASSGSRLKVSAKGAEALRMRCRLLWRTFLIIAVKVVGTEELSIKLRFAGPRVSSGAVVGHVSC